MKEPGNAELRFEIGSLLSQNGSPEIAAHWFTTTLRIDSKHAGAHQALAEFFAARGNAEMSRRHRQAAQDAAAGRAGEPENP